MQGKKRLFEHFESLYSPDKDPSVFEGENQANNQQTEYEPQLREIFDENKEKIFKRKNIHKS
jgi:hypothetical protein